MMISILVPCGIAPKLPTTIGWKKKSVFKCFLSFSGCYLEPVHHKKKEGDRPCRCPFMHADLRFQFLATPKWIQSTYKSAQHDLTYLGFISIPRKSTRGIVHPSVGRSVGWLVGHANVWNEQKRSFLTSFFISTPHSFSLWYLFIHKVKPGVDETH